ncbi:MAG: BTAD domain-containing putative transcriptional regulator [Dehalococcoidia bacterium]
MEGAERMQGSADQDNNGSWQQWQVSVQLLQLMQGDYHRARKHLEDVCSAFGEREHIAGQYLRSALALATPPVLPSIGTTALLPFLLGVPSTPPLSGAWPQQGATTALAPLQVRCLGSLEVRLGWNKLDSWRSKKAKSLFKYLIAQRGRPVPKDVLMETLWPEGDPRAANNNLKAAVHALRQTLDPGGKDGNGKEASSYILFLDGNYMISTEAEMWVDVDEFEHQWVTGRRLDKEGKVDEATRAYAAAERLYRGDFLEDDLYEDWTLLRREALKDTYLAILSKLSERSVAEEDCEGCIGYCQKILAKDPCREDAYRSLMRCHSRLGHRSRAVNWYKICLKTLRAELDTAPDSVTTELNERLLKGEYI